MILARKLRIICLRIPNLSSPQHPNSYQVISILPLKYSCNPSLPITPTAYFRLFSLLDFFFFPPKTGFPITSLLDPFSTLEPEVFLKSKPNKWHYSIRNSSTVTPCWGKNSKHFVMVPSTSRPGLSHYIASILGFSHRNDLGFRKHKALQFFLCFCNAICLEWLSSASLQ